MANTINLDEFKNVCNYLIDNNFRLEAEGKKKTAIGIEGEAGIGKTEMVRQIAQERGMTFVKLNLAQIEEVGDLTGFPLKQFKIYKKNDDGSKEEIWANGDLIQFYLNSSCDMYDVTNESRMVYAAPEWLPRETNPNGFVLFLDDFTRCNNTLIQATYEIINEGTYVGWELPEKTQIIISTNPDDGSYAVQSIDTALVSRYINFRTTFNIEGWARWAEYYGLDTRGINFALSYSNEIFKNDGVQVVNARSYTAFINAISGIKDWEKSESLAMILNISKGCFNDENNVVGRLFTLFINNKLDKLISPKDLLMKGWDSVKEEVRSCVYQKDGSYRSDVAAVLATRFLNYCMVYFDTKGSKEKVVSDRILEFIDASQEAKTRLFSEDLIFNIAKTLCSKYPGKCNKLMLNSKIREKLIK